MDLNSAHPSLSLAKTLLWTKIIPNEDFTAKYIVTKWRSIDSKFMT